MKSEHVYPPFLFGPVSYWTCMLHDNKIEIGLGGSWKKQSHRNRFEISGPNKRQVCSIPIVHASKNKGLSAVEISSRSKWQLEHIRSLDTAYLKSPFYEYYADDIREILLHPHLLIRDLLEASLNWVHLKLGAGQKLEFSDRSPNLQDEKLIFPLPSAYEQNFSGKRAFDNNVSVLDLLFNYGPESTELLKQWYIDQASSASE
jgi:hypothetical protein